MKIINKKGFLIAATFILAAGVFVYAKSKDSKEPLPFGNILTTVFSPTKTPSVTSSPLKDSADIQGTWKLISFHDLTSGKVETQPKTESNIPKQDVVVTFQGTKNKGSISGHTVTNTIWGRYEISENNRIEIGIGGTEAYEPDWGFRFRTAMNKVSFYQIEENFLLLYYNDKQNLMRLQKN